MLFIAFLKSFRQVAFHINREKCFGSLNKYRQPTSETKRPIYGESHGRQGDVWLSTVTQCLGLSLNCICCLSFLNQPHFRNLLYFSDHENRKQTKRAPLFWAFGRATSSRQFVSKSQHHERSPRDDANHLVPTRLVRPVRCGAAVHPWN
jgi:hypothetical protein